MNAQDIKATLAANGRLEHATVNADELRRAILTLEAVDAPQGVILHACRIAGRLYLSGISVPYRLYFINCDFDADIYIDNSKFLVLGFEGCRVGYIEGDNCVLASSLYLCQTRYSYAEDGINAEIRPFTATGEVSLNGATVGATINLNGARLGGQPVSLRLAHGAVKGSATFKGQFQAAGHVQFARTSIGHDLIFDGSAKFSRQLDLRAVKIGGMLDDPREAWPAPGNLLIDGLTYGRIRSFGAAPADERLDWLGRQFADGNQPGAAFSLQPYEQLAATYRAVGLPAAARRIGIAKQEAMRRAGRLGMPAWLHLCYGALLRYGYAPQRSLIAMATIAVLLMLGIEHARGTHPDAVIPTSPEAQAAFRDSGWRTAPYGYEPLRPAVYAVETLLPVVEFGQGKAWKVNPRVTWLWWTQQAANVLGWFFSAMFLAAFGGLIKKD